MPSKHLTILNAPDVTWWETRKDLPRFMQRTQHSTSPCNQCPGLCCVPRGNVTMVEALRMALLISVPLDQIVYRTRLDALDVKLEHSEPQPIPLDEGDVLLFMHLRQGQCLFLHTVGNRGFCSIYTARPGICRIYPFHVEYGKKRLRVGDQTLCPVKWVQDDTVRAHVATEMEKWDADERAEKKLLKAWRADDGEDRSWSAFIRFSVRHLAKYLDVDPDRVLAKSGPRKLGEQRA